MGRSTDGRPRRVGLLQIDTIDEPHRAIAGDYDALFRDLLVDEDVVIETFDGRESTLPAPAECHGWIVPGSRRSVDDHVDWIPRLSEWVMEAAGSGVPLVGVCFGHQLIARVLGAPVERVGWRVGAVDYRVHRLPPGVAGATAAPASFRVLASHQDQVVALPDGATLVASAPDCPVAGFSVGDRILCLQGHPEFVPELVASLYASRVPTLGRPTVEAALATLGRPLDRALVASWIADTLCAPAAPST